MLRACQEHGLVEHVRFLDAVESTQEEAFAIAREQGPTLVIAHHQVAGRGRLGRDWQESPGLGLACTVALPIARVAHEGLSARVGVACAWALEGVGLARARIKWPNDVLDDKDRKLAGILIEVRDGWALVGVGVNVLHRPEHFPEDIRDQTVSLAMLGVQSGVEELAGSLVASLARSLAESPESIKDAWRARDALVGLKRSFETSNRTVTGVVQAIDPFQEITVRTPQGVERLDPRTASLTRT